MINLGLAVWLEATYKNSETNKFRHGWFNEGAYYNRYSGENYNSVLACWKYECGNLSRIPEQRASV